MVILELRKYAIDQRVDIRFGIPHTSQECLISSRGQIKIPGDDKNLRAEEVFDAAENFAVVGQGATQYFTRDEMARAVAESSKKRGSTASAEEED
jgi:hypothetical protein